MFLKTIENNLSLVEFSQRLKNNYCIIKNKQNKNKNFVVPQKLIQQEFFIKKGLFLIYNIFNSWGIKFPAAALFNKSFQFFKENLYSIKNTDSIIIIKLKNVYIRHNKNYPILIFFDEILLYCILQSFLSINKYIFTLKKITD